MSLGPTGIEEVLGRVRLNSRDPARIRLREKDGSVRDSAEVPSGGAVLGRNESADISLVGDEDIVSYVSSFHALIQPRGSIWTIVDNHSTHGTVMGRRIAPSSAAAGDWREFRLAPVVPTPLVHQCQISLAGLIRFEIEILEGVPGLSPTRGRDGVSAMAVLVAEPEQELARTLIDIHRAGRVPGRKEVAAELGWSESKVNKRRLALSEFPPVKQFLRREDVVDISLPTLARALATVLPYY